MIILKKVFEHYPNSKKKPLGPQKAINNPKIRKKIKVRIKGDIENRSCSAINSEHKTVFETYQMPQNGHFDPKSARISRFQRNIRHITSQM